jgi:hypothetical protein
MDLDRIGTHGPCPLEGKVKPTGRIDMSTKNRHR